MLSTNSGSIFPVADPAPLRVRVAKSGARGRPSLAGDGAQSKRLLLQSLRKGDSEAKAVAVNQSPVAALAAASEITGLPGDNFEVHEISKPEFEKLRA